MIKLNAHKSSTLQFNIDVKNIDPKDLRGYFRLVHDDIEYGFPVKILGNRNSAQVDIPALDVVICNLTTSSVMDAKLEFMGGRDYVIAWVDSAMVNISPKVDMMVQEELEKPRPEKPRPIIEAKNVEVSDSAWDAITETVEMKLPMKDVASKTFGDLFEAKPKIVKTSTNLGHWHEAQLDEEGDGQTVKTFRIDSDEKPNPHDHKITGTEIEKTNGHGHSI